MSIVNLVITKGLVAQTNTKVPQLFRVTAATADIHSGIVDLAWQNMDNDSNVDEPFATANIHYKNVNK